MSNSLAMLRSVISSLLASGSEPVTRELIRTRISESRSLPFINVSEVEAEKLAREFEERLDIVIELPGVLTDNSLHKPWLAHSKNRIDNYYWERYRQMLVDSDLPAQVIANVDAVTDRTLDQLGNPENLNAWDRRGMVVGHVQSGKTSNFIGLTCKAADAGYKVIVIIAGIHNNLRNQTQARIDEGFVGFDSVRAIEFKEQSIVGVGNYATSRRPSAFTTAATDFNKRQASSVSLSLDGMKEPAVFVIKKNSNTLDRLLDWLRFSAIKSGATKSDLPLLVIDDEADNASINVSTSKDSVSRINGYLRQMLSLFTHSSYVGYTATPFANIFIEPDSNADMIGDDLFPRNFIVSLDPPSKLCWTRKILSG